MRVCRRNVSLEHQSKDLLLFALLLPQIYKHVQEPELGETHVLPHC